jgi:hypothetical protein
MRRRPWLRLTLPQGADDPGADWARVTLAPLRHREADVDIAATVMRRIAHETLAPAPPPLPGMWPQVAWAGAFLGGFAAMALLVTTLGAMIVGGDEGARTAMTLAGTFARATLSGMEYMAGALRALAGAGFAVVKGLWTLVDALAPLVRGGAFAGALAGLGSIVISIIVVSRARRTAPAYNGGLS